MRRRLFKLLMPSLVVLGLLLSGVVPAIASPGNAPGRYIVVMKPGVDTINVAKEHGVAIAHSYTHALNGFAAPLSPAQFQALATDPRVAYIEPDLVVHICEQTLPTGVNRIDAELNASANIDGVDDQMDVDIAIIDTGIDKDHPDLNVLGGRRFYTVTTGPPWDRGTYEDDNYDDDNGHGSHVAGSAAAIDNTYGVVGVAPGAKLWGVKVLDASGSGYLSDVIAGIDWVTERDTVIEVANMSLIWQGNSSAARTAIQNSVAKGVVYVVAAGNDAEDVYGPDGTFGTSDDFEPASYPEVATISAMADSDGQPGGTGGSTSYGADDSFASFSNFSASVVVGNPVDSPGAAIDLLMPGVDIYSTHKDGGYATKSGTSMASPHGAGLAALYIAVNGRASDAAQVHAIRQALIVGGVAQNSPQGLATLNDPDGNWENIGWAGTPGDLPPVADAGPDQTASDSDGDGDEVVTLDGSASYDPDGSITVYKWTKNGNELSDKVSFDYSFVVGSHTVTLTVTDDEDLTDTDDVMVTVNPNQPPVADAGPDQTVVDEEGDGETVTLDASGGGPIAFDAASSSSDTDVSSLSWSHTTGNGNDRMMIVGASIRGGASISSVTYGVQSFTNIRVDQPGSDIRTELWYLEDPSDGTGNVQINLSPDQSLVAGATTWTGVGQAAVLGNDAGATGHGSTASVDVDSASGEVVVDVVGTQNAGATVAVGLGQTERWNTQGQHCNGAVSSELGATSVTMSWDLATVESWAVSAVALLSAGGSYDPDGTIDSYEWKEGDTVLGITASITTNFSLGEHTVTLTVTDDGGATATDTVVVTVKPPSEPPTSGDKSVDTDEDTPVIVTLTATDTEECELTFSIVDPPLHGSLSGITNEDCTVGTPNTDSATVTYTPNADFYGNDSFTYKANDGTSDGNTATVSITVNAVNDAPVALFTYNCTGLSCDFNGSFSYDPDGAIVEYAWDFGDDETGSGATDSHTYKVAGTYTVELTVTDDDGTTGSDSQAVTVSEAATTMHVGDLDGSKDLKGASGRWEVFVTVTIHDENCNPVANATVTGEWSDAKTGTASGTTGSDGIVTFSTGNMSGGTEVTFTVTDVTHATLLYKSDDNHDPDGDSITIYK